MIVKSQRKRIELVTRPDIVGGKEKLGPPNSVGKLLVFPTNQCQTAVVTGGPTQNREQHQESDPTDKVEEKIGRDAAIIVLPQSYGLGK